MSSKVSVLRFFLNRDAGRSLWCRNVNSVCVPGWTEARTRLTQHPSFQSGPYNPISRMYGEVVYVPGIKPYSKKLMSHHQVVPYVSLCVKRCFHILCRYFSEGNAAKHEIDHSSSSSATGSECGTAMPTVGFRGTLLWQNAVYLWSKEQCQQVTVFLKSTIVKA